MHSRLLISLGLALTACGVSDVDAHVPRGPIEAGDAPVKYADQSAALIGDPFVPTLSGHRLAVAGDVALVADPEGAGEDGKNPQLYFLSVSQRALLGSANLPKGSNPQGIAVASDGAAYVLAIGLGGVITVDVAARTIGKFTSVCTAPVDIATREADVLVACRGGEVVTLTHTGKETTQLPPGLMRIAVDVQDRVFVATSDAQIIEVGVSAPVGMPGVPLPGSSRVANANTPRRLVPLPGGGVGMLFQQALAGELTETNGPPIQSYSGTTLTDCSVPAARVAMSTYSPESGFSGQHWSPSTLGIDAAPSPDGQLLAIADPAGNAVHFEALAIGSNNDACTSDNPGPTTDLSGNPGGNTNPGGTGSNPGTPGTGGTGGSGGTIGSGPGVPNGLMPTSVAWSGSTLLVLSAAPVLQVDTIQEGNTTTDPQPIVLRARTLSPGFVIFHQNPSPGSGAPGLSCASCHPDGLSSGATTTVNGVTRRVMPLAGHLANASIVHWEAQSFHDAVSEGTWHTNMGGDSLTTDQEQSLNEFVGQLKAPGRPAGDPTQVALGQQLFESSGCAGCHNPTNAYTNDSVADVGHGLHKVPSLVGLVYTAPYMSDGCAPTLEARFNDTACGGGAQHGNTQSLTPDQQAALITFLKTL